MPSKRFTHKIADTRVALDPNTREKLIQSLNAIVIEKTKNIIENPKYKATGLELALRNEIGRDAFIGGLFKQLDPDWHNIVMEAFIAMNAFDKKAACAAITTYSDAHVHKTTPMWENVAQAYHNLQEQASYREGYGSPRFNIMPTDMLWGSIQQLNHQFKNKEIFDQTIRKWFILKSRAQQANNISLMEQLDAWMTHTLLNHPIEATMIAIARATSKRSTSGQLISVFDGLNQEYRNTINHRLGRYFTYIQADLGSTIRSFNQAVYGEDSKIWKDVQHYFHALQHCNKLQLHQWDVAEATWTVLPEQKSEMRKYRQWLEVLANTSKALTPIDLDMGI